MGYCGSAICVVCSAEASVAISLLSVLTRFCGWPAASRERSSRVLELVRSGSSGRNSGNVVDNSACDAQRILAGSFQREVVFLIKHSNVVTLHGIVGEQAKALDVIVIGGIARGVGRNVDKHQGAGGFIFCA